MQIGEDKPDKDIPSKKKGKKPHTCTAQNLKKAESVKEIPSSKQKGKKSTIVLDKKRKSNPDNFGGEAESGPSNEQGKAEKLLRNYQVMLTNRE